MESFVPMNTYIYIRINEYWSNKKIVKLGKTNNPNDRESSYITSEPDKGRFVKIYLVNDINTEEYLKIKFEQYNYKGTGGTEFFDECIIDKIEDEMNKLDIDYKLVDIKDTPPATKTNSQPISPPKLPELSECTENIVEDKLILRDEVQKSSHNIFVQKLDMNEYFQGIYYIATGIGKTYIAYMNCLYHLSKYPNDNILWITYKHEIINSQDTDYLGDKLVKFDEQNIDYINSLTGKVIIVLRQKLQNVYDKLNKNIIQGIIYDECHDACKISIEKTKIVNSNVEKTIEGKTFDILMFLEKNNNLKYRIGYSATPLTSSKKQNAGLLQLYGCKITNQINYLYTCNIVDGVNKNLILKPNIKFYPIKDICLLNKFDPKMHGDLVDNIIEFIKNIIKKDKFYYKKFIIWFPTIEISHYFYDKFDDVNIKKFISNSNTKNDDEKIFKIIENNAIMFACDKFTTGFNATNLECGINFKTNEDKNRNTASASRLELFFEK